MRSGTICIFCFLLVGLATAGRGRRKKATVLTYNPALLETLGLYTLGPDDMPPSRTTRRDAVIEKLKKTRADVLCLQEAWYGEDVNVIVDELEPKFPYSFSALHDASGSLIMDGLSAQPACPSDVFLSFVNCVIPANCPAATTLTDLVMCINDSCSTEFMNLPEACWTCFITNGRNFTELALRCTDTILPGPYRKMNGAGLILLSKRRMRNQAYVNLHPGVRQVLPRGYIEAEGNRAVFNQHSVDPTCKLCSLAPETRRELTDKLLRNQVFSGVTNECVKNPESLTQLMLDASVVLKHWDSQSEALNTLELQSREFLYKIHQKRIAKLKLIA